MPSKVELQVELIEKNAEARLRNLDKLAKEMANRKITLNFDESSLARWKTATEGMTNAQLSAYAKLAVGAENAAAKVVAADVRANQKRVSDEQKTNAKILADRQKSFDKKYELMEKEDTKRRQIAARTAQTEINAQTKITVATMKGAQGVRKLKTETDALNTSSKQTDSIWSSLTARFTAANLISSAITAGISRLRSALREAVSDLKEMDKELTTIKMVTGASDYDISKLTEQAFAGARSNGRSVNDYLTAAERFARAGYRDNIDQLSKLSLMTQNIGGVEEETAAKFLLAADAAWKLNGSYDALMGVLDGVSAVADQNATDLSKIAEGITVAGSAFANAGESAQTFTAMLGVTTASTQRSGSEMARGLRMILFRVRQVKAEFDDGEIVDDKAISNAAKALSDVGISVLDETGDLKSLSQILEELSKKWGSLSKAQQSYLQNYLAGNRNGNVLYALMDNWGAYEKMLQQYEESSGTALEKNATYTDSWAAATNNLKTAWTETVSLMTDSGGILHNLTTEMALIVEGINKSLAYQAGVRNNFKTAQTLGILTPEDVMMYEEFGTLTDETLSLVKAYEKAQQDGEKLTKTLQDQTESIVDHTEATENDTDAVEESTNAFDKQREKIAEVAKAIKEEKNDAVNSLADIYKAAMEAAEKGYYGSNAYRKGGGLFFSEDSLSQLEKEGKLAAKEYLDAYFKEAESGDYSTAAANFFGKITEGSNEIKSANGEVLASVKDVGDGYQWTFDKGNQSMEEYLQSLEQNTGIGQAFWASMMESLGMYSAELAKWEENNGEVETKAEIDTEEAEQKADTLWDKYEKLREDVVTKAEAQTKQAEKAAKYLTDVLDRIPRQITSKINVVTVVGGNTNTGGGGSGGYSGGGGGINLLRDEGASSILGRMGYASGKRDSYSGIALVNDEYPANGSKPELIISRSSGTAYIANGGKPALVNLASDDVVLTASETRNAIGVPGFAVGKSFFKGGSSISVVTPKGSGSKSASGAAGESAAADSTDTWNQLKKLIDYMVEEQKGILDQNLKVLDKQLEELEATRKAQKDEDELTEKQLKVDEALLELQKAQNERTVRYYNESTHQWEWMADQGVLAQAEEAYSDALKELKDFLSDLDFNEQKAAIQAQKDALQEAFDAYKEGWDLIVKSIEKPTGDLAALFEELKTNGTEAMQSQADNISALLDALELGFFYGIGDVTGNANSGIGDVTTAASSGIGDVTGAAASGVTEVVNRANAFLESVKQAENNAKAAEQAKASSGGGGGGSSTGSKGGGSTGGNTKSTGPKSGSSKLSDVKQGLSTVVSLYTATTEAVNHAIGVLTSSNASTIANTDYLKKMDTSSTVQTSYKSSNNTINNSGNNTYINGVKIGSDMLTKPLNSILSTLSLHANSTR